MKQQKLVSFAKAGLKALKVAINEAETAYKKNFVPIAGAVVATNGNVLGRGHNQRVGNFPVLHGETSCLYNMQDISKIDWEKTVFATTLSPCIMCFSLINYLRKKGLKHIVVGLGKAKGFQGTAKTLEKLNLKVVSLAHPKSLEMMEGFAKKYPKIWDADIGELPANNKFRRKFPFQKKEIEEYFKRTKELIEKGKYSIASLVVGKNKEILGESNDLREKFGDNPVYSSVMMAIGKAGSHINIKDTALFVFSQSRKRKIDEKLFGEVSVGVCQLFRPAYVVSNKPLIEDLKKKLEKFKIKLIN